MKLHNLYCHTQERRHLYEKYGRARSNLTKFEADSKLKLSGWNWIFFYISNKKSFLFLKYVLRIARNKLGIYNIIQTGCFLCTELKLQSNIWTRIFQEFRCRLSYWQNSDRKSGKFINTSPDVILSDGSGIFEELKKIFKSIWFLQFRFFKNSDKN